MSPDEGEQLPRRPPNPTEPGGRLEGPPLSYSRPPDPGAPGWSQGTGYVSHGPTSARPVDHGQESGRRRVAFIVVFLVLAVIALTAVIAFVIANG